MSPVDDEDDMPDEAEALDNDQIGTIGQKAFSYLCSQALITSTPPEKDKYGWDYQLQWVRQGESFEPPESCFVQVKTVSKGARSASITFSNWRRMAHGHAPWFVVAVALQDREAESFYVVPIDEALVARAVKKLHDRDGSIPENRATMAIRWGDPHRLERPFHTSFLAALKAHMGPSDTDYRLQKGGWIKAAQRVATQSDTPYPVPAPGEQDVQKRGSIEATRSEGAEIRARFSIAAPSEWEFHRMLARFAVGLDESLPIKDVKSDDDEGEHPLLEEGRITLRDRTPHATATMSLFDRDHSDTVTLKLDAFISGRVFPFLPNTTQIARFIGPLISFAWEPVDEEQATFNTHLSVPWDGMFRLGDLSRASRAARMFADARVKGLRASIECRFLKHALQVDLSASPGDAFSPDVRDAMRVVEDAGLLARYFDMDAESIELSVDELMDRRWSIRVFAAGIDRTLGQFDARVVMRPDEPLAGKKCAIVLLTVVPLGKYVLAGVFSLGGIADWEDGEVSGTGTMGIANPDVKLRIKQLVTREQWDGLAFRDRLDAMLKTLDAEGYEVIVRKASDLESRQLLAARPPRTD